MSWDMELCFEKLLVNNCTLFDHEWNIISRNSHEYAKRRNQRIDINSARITVAWKEDLSKSSKIQYEIQKWIYNISSIFGNMHLAMTFTDIHRPT